MRATLEPVAWVLRLHDDDGAVLGDPYSGSATVTVDEAHVATLRGLTMRRGFNKAAWMAIDEVLATAGIRRALYSRRKVRVLDVSVRGHADHDG